MIPLTLIGGPEYASAQHSRDDEDATLSSWWIAGTPVQSPGSLSSHGSHSGEHSGQKKVCGRFRHGGSWQVCTAFRDEVYDRTFRSTAYLPFDQSPPRDMDFALRTPADPMAMVAAVRSRMLQVDGKQALELIETIVEKIGKQGAALQ